MGHMMIPASQDFRFLALTAALVVLLGMKSVGDLFAEETPKRIEAAESTVAGPRHPASLAREAMKPSPIAVAHETLLQWNCQTQPRVETAMVKGGAFRLKGLGCGKSFSAEQLEIVNETNGFTASVFSKGPGFETDLIHVKEGSNRLRLQYKSPSGAVIESVLHITSTSL